MLLRFLHISFAVVDEPIVALQVGRKTSKGNKGRSQWGKSKELTNSRKKTGEIKTHFLIKNSAPPLAESHVLFSMSPTDASAPRHCYKTLYKLFPSLIPNVIVSWLVIPSVMRTYSFRSQNKSTTTRLTHCHGLKRYVLRQI